MGLEEIEVAAILIWIITKSKNVRKKNEECVINE